MLVNLVDISPAERRVDLHRKSNLICPANGVERSRKRPTHAAECVVRLGTGAVHAHGKPGKASLFQSAQSHLSSAKAWRSASAKL